MKPVHTVKQKSESFLKRIKGVSVKPFPIHIMTTVSFLLLFFGTAAGRGFQETIDASTDPSQWNPAAPWKLPEGYTQSVVSDETDLNIYDAGRSDMNDMLTVNETGPMAGRFLYRTHEVPDAPEGGAVSVIDLQTGNTSILVQDPTWRMIDGLRWTPWGTLLFAEEIPGGRFFEFVLNDDRISGTLHQRDAVGRLAHEGIGIDRHGNLYVVDEWRGLTSSCGNITPCGGGIYKFVPDNYGDLSSGQLYVLKIVDGDTFEGTGQAAWVGPVDSLNAREDAARQGGQHYQRPEDIEIIGDILYVAVTEGTPDEDGNELYGGRVLAIDLETLRVSDYVKPGVNVPVEAGRPGDENFQTGLKHPDNLAQTPDGKLMIVEDNVPGDIWIASGTGPVAEKVILFGSLSDPEAEGTGIYFSPLDLTTLYVNVQHSKKPDGDATWAIRKGPQSAK